MSDLKQRMERAKRFLSCAQQLVPRTDDTEVGIRHYASYLKVNELELAADALATLEEIGSFRPPAGFWEALRDAAATLGNEDRAREYATRAKESR